MTTYRLLDEIYSVIRAYTVRSITLPALCNKVIEYEKAGGSIAFITDDRHRDYKIICVDDHRFKIVRYPGWTRYDVEPID